MATRNMSTVIANKKLVDNYIYFYHLDKFCIIPMYPDNVTDVLQSSFASTNALARTAPVFTYQNSGPRTLQVSLDLHRDLMDDMNKHVSNLKANVVDFSGDDYVDTLIKYLQAAAMPKYNAYNASSRTIIPPMVAIRFGDEIFIKGVVTSGITLNYRAPVLASNKYAFCNVSFTISETDPYDVNDVVAEGSFRGVTAAFKDGIYESTAAGPTVNSSKTDSYNTENLTDTIRDASGNNLSQKKNPYWNSNTAYV